MNKKLEIKKIYSLTPIQEGILFHSLMGDSSTYFIQQEYIIEGNLDVDILQKSFNLIIHNYDIFRTNFVYKKIKEPKQVVFKERKCKINYIDISDYDEGDKENFITKFKEEDKEKGFDLVKKMLTRLSVIKVEENSYRIIWSVHHIIIDGWCIQLLSKEMFDIYKDIKKGNSIITTEKQQYGTYVEWVKEQPASEAKSYWKNYLQGYNKKVSLFNQLENKDNAYKLKRCAEIIDEKMLQKLREIAKNKNVTVNTILQVAWGILLQKYNNVDDVVFGYVTSTRTADVSNIDEMMGPFINTVPLRIKGASNKKISDILSEVQEQTLQSQRYNYYSLAEIQSNSMLKQELINHIMITENYPMEESLKENFSKEELGFTISPASAFEQNNYDFNIIFIFKGNLEFRIEYNSLTFTSNEISRIKKHYFTILNKIIENNEVLLKDINIITEDEKNQIELFNKTENEYDKYKTIGELFDEQVEKSREETAVIFENEKLTYDELNKKAEKVAHSLIEMNVEAGSIVGILVERSVEMLIAILGVLKAGCTYMPIDPTYPSKRINYMIDNSDTKVLINYRCSLKDLDFKGIVLDLDDEKFYSSDDSKLPLRCNHKSIAYVNYTSGSTGKPKGVMISHQALNNFIQGVSKKINFKSKRKILSLTSISFDIFGLETILPIINGMTVVIANRECQQDVAKIRETIIKENIDILQVTPSRMELLLNCEDKSFLSGVSDLLIGGERLHKDLLNKLKCFDHCKIFNMYGPTETTIWSTIKEINELNEDITIGTPISNTKVYILDKDSNMQPIGIPGELCILGDGLSAGYKGREDLTKERFIDNPFTGEGKIYKTGDVARWLENGELECFGRIDDQVKVRGYRVELEEVRANILEYEGIKEAAVIVRSDDTGFNFICAYVVCEENLDVYKIREFLNNKIPEYMIPTYFIKLDKLPLNFNGKIDKQALKQLEYKSYDSSSYVAPATEIEIKLIDIWKRILDIDKVGIMDNFFEIGGHSLKAASLISLINKELNLDLNVVDIFKYTTIKELAELIEKQDTKVYEAIPKAEDKKYYNLSSAQKRMFILDSIEEKNCSYNMPVTYIIEGKLDVNKLRLVFNELIKRHEILRTSFEFIDGKPVQIIHDDKQINIDYENVEEVFAPLKEEEESKFIMNLLSDFVRPFDLKVVPLMRSKILKLEKEKYLLMSDMHHIISDEISMGILMKDIVSLYKGEKLPELKIQYRDFAEWQINQFSSKKLDNQEKYWINKFSGEIPQVNLPIDNIRPAKISYEGDSVNFVIEKESIRELKKILNETGSTLYMFILAVFNIFIFKYTNQNDIIIGSPISGRKYEGLENIIGVFINTVLMRNNPKSDITFEEFIKDVKKNTIEAYENQDYQFENLVDKLNIKRDLSRNTLFDVAFILNRNECEALEIDNLKFSPYKCNAQISKFDLTLIADETEKAINFEMEYSKKLFRRETMERMAEEFKYILRQVVSNYKMKISDISLITEDEKNHLLYKFNDTEKELIGFDSIDEWIDNEAEKNPAKIAVSYKDENLSYKELNEKANKLAAKLIKRGVKAGTFVGILLKRTPNMLVGILAILKAGGAYVPLDIKYPEERIKYILEDSKTRILITEKDVMSKAEIDVNNNLECLYIEDELLSEDCSYIRRKKNRDNLAYVIYTSGSTGKPKGVMIKHDSVINFISGVTEKIQFSNDRSILALTTICFDIFVLETLLPLTQGVRVVIADEEEQVNMNLLGKVILNNNVDMLQITPSRLQLLLQDKRNEEAFKKLKAIMVGGEAFPKQLLEKLRSVYSGEIYNMYGPTETTVWSTIAHIQNDKKINIGKPIANTEIYILDENNKLVPIGVSGELCIGGYGLAKGYLKNEKLNSEKFIDVNFGDRKRIYKTGDLAKWLPNGEIEYIGRKDYQVKVRGYRIELGEIEENIKQFDDITNCVVISKKDERENDNLIAYYVSNKNIDASELREDLYKKLPDYMIPQMFINIDNIPMTPNGKVDRNKLPDYKKFITNASKEIEKPKNEVEKEIFNIWVDVLNCEAISTNANFFDIGGNSLLLIEMHSKIDEKYPNIFTVARLFSYPTIKAMAKYIIKCKNSENLDSLCEFPKEFFNSRILQWESKIIESTIENEWYIKLDSLSKKLEIDKFYILEACYIFLLSKVTSKQKITIQSINKKGNIFDLCIDINNLDNIRSLVERVYNKSLLSEEMDSIHYNSTIDEDDFNNSRKIRSIMYSDIYKGNNELDEYDITLRVSDIEEKIYIYTEFNKNRLKEDKINNLLNKYIHLVKGILR